MSEPENDSAKTSRKDREECCKLFRARAEAVSAVVLDVATPEEAFARAVEICERKEACRLLLSGCQLPLSDKATDLCETKPGTKIMAAPGLRAAAPAGAAGGPGYEKEAGSRNHPGSEGDSGSERDSSSEGDSGSERDSSSEGDSGSRNGPRATSGDGQWFRQLGKLCAEKGIVLLDGGLRHHLGGIDIGFAVADYGIAETGTLVFFSRSEDLRLATMISEIHVALMPKSRIRQSAFDIAPELTEQMRNAPDYTAFVTGASRTADIERVLTLGVHGPLELYILLWEDN